MQVIVVGGGEVGRTIAARLSREANDVTLVDTDPDKVREIADHLDVRTVLGNGSSPSILLEAGIDAAEMVIAVTNSDEVNLLACLMAGAASAATAKIARVRDPDFLAHADVLARSGLSLDLVINPERVTAEKIQRILAVPQATDVAAFAEGRVLLVGMHVPAGSPLAGARLADLTTLRHTPYVLIAAINRGGRILIPKGDDRIQADDVVYATTAADRLEALTQFFGVDLRPARRVIVHGGGNIAFFLARELESEGVYVKIIEEDARRCERLSEQLRKTVVLHGNGADRELLEEEGVRGCDAYIALTEDQEDNILSALLAKRLGARSVHALIEHSADSPIASAIGVDVPLSPRVTAVSSILQFVRRGNILQVAAFQEEEAEAIEVEAMETSSIVGRPLVDVKFPKGAIVGAIVRGEETIIPRGSTVIEHGDRVIIFALTKAIRAVEKAVAVSLEFF